MRRSTIPPTPHLDDVIPDLVLGRAFETVEEAHVHECERCADRFVQLRKRLTTTLESVQSKTSLRGLLAHMMAELDVRGDLVRFAPEVADLLDLTEDQTWSLLERIEDAKIGRAHV